MPQSPSKPLAYSYIRMSTDIQLRGDSLRRQKELSARYAEEHGLELLDAGLEDIGVSAYTGDNIASGSLGRFLQAVVERKVPQGSYLLVESFDRLSRQRLDASVPLFFDITRNGINLVTLADNQLYRAGEANLQQLIYSIVVMARANEESEMKSKRIAAAWDQKRRQTSERKLTAQCPAWLSLSEDRRSFIVDEQRACVVKSIFEASASGSGTYVITRSLNERGVEPFGRSEGWVESYVAKILQNRAVLGEFQPHTKRAGKRTTTGDPIDGYYPAIVTEELFLRAQYARMKRRTEGGGRKGAQLRNLFTHLATCGYCGSPMHLINKGEGPKGGISLKCSKAIRGLDCIAKGWRYSDFERSFFSFVREIDLAALLHSSTRKTEAIALDEQVKALTAKKAQLELQRERTYALVNQADVPTEFLAGKLKACEADIVGVEAKLQTLIAKRDSLREQQAISPDQLHALIDQLQDFESAEAFEVRTALATQLREIVTTLSLEVEGSRPRLADAQRLLDGAGAEKSFTEQVLDRIRSTSEAGRRHNPTFTVTLADGTSRRVVVGGHPTQYVAEAVVDAFGTTRFHEAL